MSWRAQSANPTATTISEWAARSGRFMLFPAAAPVTPKVTDSVLVAVSLLIVSLLSRIPTPPTTPGRELPAFCWACPQAGTYLLLILFTKATPISAFIFRMIGRYVPACGQAQQKAGN